jgi:hypothetical protein
VETYVQFKTVRGDQQANALLEQGWKPLKMTLMPPEPLPRGAIAHGQRAVPTLYTMALPANVTTREWSRVLTIHGDEVASAYTRRGYVLMEVLHFLGDPVRMATSTNPVRNQYTIYVMGEPMSLVAGSPVPIKHPEVAPEPVYLEAQPVVVHKGPGRPKKEEPEKEEVLV